MAIVLAVWRVARILKQNPRWQPLADRVMGPVPVNFVYYGRALGLG